MDFYANIPVVSGVTTPTPTPANLATIPPQNLVVAPDAIGNSTTPPNAAIFFFPHAADEVVIQLRIWGIVPGTIPGWTDILRPQPFKAVAGMEFGALGNLAVGANLYVSLTGPAFGPFYIQVTGDTLGGGAVNLRMGVTTL